MWRTLFRVFTHSVLFLRNLYALCRLSCFHYYSLIPNMAVSGALDVICTAISRVISIRIGTSVFGPAGHHHRRLADWALFALHSLVLFLHFDSFYNSYILLICFFYLKLLSLIYLFVYKTGEIHLSSNTFLDRRFPIQFYLCCMCIHTHSFVPAKFI